MDLTEKALTAAETLGRKSGRNCIAELDPAAIEQARYFKSNSSQDPG